MSIFKKNTTKKEIETSLNEIDEKAYGKYKGQLDVFAKRMEGYSHRLNVKY